MQTSGFLTRSVASLAISRNFAARLGSGGHALGFAALQTQELLPVAALLVHLPQVFDGLPVVRVDREDRLVGLHRFGLVRELGDVEVRGLRVERHLLVGIADEARELEQRLDVLVVALRGFLLLGQLPELGDLRVVDGRRGGGRGGRRRRRRFDGRRRGSDLARRPRPEPAAGVTSRAAATGAGAGVTSRAAAAGTCTGAVRGGAGLQGLADLGLEGAQLRVLGRNGAQALERQARTDQVAELPPRDRARLGEQEGAVAVLDARRRFLGEIEHAGPVARLLAVGLAQEEERALVLRIEPQRLFEEPRAHFEVLVAKHPARPERERQVPARLGAGRLLQGLVLRLLERVEPALLGEEPLVESGHLLVDGVRRVRARQQRLGIVGGKAPGDPRGAQESPRLDGAVARVVRRARQGLEVLLGGLGLDLRVFQAGARLGVLAAAGAQGASVRCRRLFPVPLVAQDVAQLDQKCARPGGCCRRPSAPARGASGPCSACRGPSRRSERTRGSR